MRKFAHVFLLRHQHVHERLLVFLFFQLLIKRLLRFRHRATDAVPLPFVFTDINTGTWNFGHVNLG